MKPVVTLASDVGPRISSPPLLSYPRQSMNALKRLAITASILAGLNLSASTPLVIERGASRPIEPHFLGFNQNFMGQTDPWDDRLVNQLRSTGVANFRYPAGTVGSSWNWRTGRVDENLPPEDVMTWVRPHARGGPRAGSGRYTLENFKRAVDGAGIAPVLMLGMAVHDLPEQIEILKAAEAAGLPVRYLELGNEIIFQDAEPKLERMFPDAETYGRIASEWIAALRSAFPQAKIAACGTFVGSDSQSERRRTWNPRMMTTLRGTNIITTHLYAGEIVRTERERLGLSEVQAQQNLTARERAARDLAPTPENSARAIGLAYEVWEKLVTKSQIPAGMEVWVTEWSTGGVGGGGAHWQTSLVTAALLDAFLRTNVTLACHHTMGSVFSRPPGAERNPDNPGDGGPTTDELNATGVALREFALAMNGRNRTTPLRFPSAPTVSLPTGRTYPAVTGWSFGDLASEKDSTAILLNLGAEVIQIDTAGLPVTGRLFRQLTGSPDANPAQIPRQTGAVTETMSLPAFSLTVIHP
jgi:hypothetical protein